MVTDLGNRCNYSKLNSTGNLVTKVNLVTRRTMVTLVTKGEIHIRVFM